MIMEHVIKVNRCGLFSVIETGQEQDEAVNKKQDTCMALACRKKAKHKIHTDELLRSCRNLKRDGA